jgi:hypothetical protein
MLFTGTVAFTSLLLAMMMNALTCVFARHQKNKGTLEKASNFELSALISSESNFSCNLKSPKSLRKCSSIFLLFIKKVL